MSDRIQKLANLPRDWVNDRIARVMCAAPHLLSPLLETKDLAVATFDWPEFDLPNPCFAATSCPVDPVGQHSLEAMSPLLVGEFIGSQARRVMFGDLTPERIRFIHAHAVVRAQQSDRDNLVNSLGTRPGDARSYGGVYAYVSLPDDELFRFITAVEGVDPWYNHQLAAVLAETIIADLFAEGRLPDLTIASLSFILGA